MLLLLFFCHKIFFFIITFLISALQVRRLIGDFGVPIAIFLMIVVDYNIDDTYTQVGPRFSTSWSEFMHKINQWLFLHRN